MEAKYSTNTCETLCDEGGFAHYQLLQGDVQFINIISDTHRASSVMDEIAVYL